MILRQNRGEANTPLTDSLSNLPAIVVHSTENPFSEGPVCRAIEFD